MDVIKINDHLLPNISKTKIEKVKGIILHMNREKYSSKTYADNYYKDLVDDNKINIDKGFHYVIMQKQISRLVNDSFQVKITASKPTYINTNLYENKASESMINIEILFGEISDTEITDKNIIRFVAELLKKHKLKPIDVWRARDLYDDSLEPLHYLDTKYFKAFINQLKKFIPDDIVADTDTETEIIDKIDFDKVIFESSFKSYSASEDTVDKYIRKIIEDNIVGYKDYATKFKAWDKDISAAKDSATSTGELKTKQYDTSKNTLQYTITQQSPTGSCGCSDAFDSIDFTLTTDRTLVEPIYPDIIIPPGGTIVIAQESGVINHENASTEHPDLDDFENKQNVFDFEGFDEAIKETKGRPVNLDDPFPVDEQIKKLEEHFPKVKIDKTLSEVTDTNHTGSAIGEAVAKNMAMTYDMISEVSKRTEKRLVKIENNLSTVMRNLFRMSARVDINCVYYGGQSIYSKFNGIRCLDDNRIHDGATVSLDQCLSCSRFEPVAGQVYAILDDTGSNVTQIMDDLQMAYMTTEDYMNMSKADEYNKDKNPAKLKKEIPSETPKPFREDKWRDSEKVEKEKLKDIPEDKLEEAKENYKNGFAMEWTPTALETHSPNINIYKNEETDILKPIPNLEDLTDNEKLNFVDTREDAVEYEELIFDIKNYEIEGFGNKSSGGSSGQNSGGLLARSKIVEYVTKAAKLCADGKVKYSQENRYAHEGQKGTGPIEGISYWDCSSLVYEAYASAGIILTGEVTWTQFPLCKEAQGGQFTMLKDVKDAKAGDILFFSKTSRPEDVKGLQDMIDKHCTHVGIYVGDGKYIDTARPHEDSTKDLKEHPIGWDKSSELCFGRPKDLIALDNSGGNTGYWSRAYHSIPDDMWALASSVESNAKAAIGNMNKYGYKQVLIEAGKETGYDPYLIFAIAAAESNGNPLAGPYQGTASQSGIMQCDGGVTTTSVSGIKGEFIKAMNVFKSKKGHLKNCGWTEEGQASYLNAYNYGEGNVSNALGYTNQSKYSMPKVSWNALVPEVSNAIHDYANKYNIYGGDSGNIRKAYLSKIIRAYEYLYSENPLELPRENSGTGFVIPVPESHRITSPFGPRKHPITGELGRMHNGVDTGSPMNTDIKATASGTVVFASVNGSMSSGYGRLIKISHAENKESRYAHLNSFNVKVGDIVNQGDIIGKVGSSGGSTGPHLHFEIRTGEVAENPVNYIPQWKK